MVVVIVDVDVVVVIVIAGVFLYSFANLKIIAAASFNSVLLIVYCIHSRVSLEFVPVKCIHSVWHGVVAWTDLTSFAGVLLAKRALCSLRCEPRTMLINQ